MVNNGIWIVDDDSDDRELVRDIFEEAKIPNELAFFSGAAQLLARLEAETYAPFIIICDVNLPGIDGFQLREMLLERSNKKFHSVPFVFWSTYASEAQIDKAYKLRAHGFFIKELDYKEWKEPLLEIIRYWSKSKMPSKKDAPDPPQR